MKAIALISVLALAGCGQRLAPVDYADAATTAIALADGGFVEVNPILAPAGDAAPLAALALKYVLKNAAVWGGLEPGTASGLVETGSSFGACHNATLLIGGATPLAIFVGLICAAAYADWSFRPAR